MLRRIRPSRFPRAGELIVTVLAALAFHEIVSALEIVGDQKEQLDGLHEQMDTLAATAEELQHALADAQLASQRAQTAADKAESTASALNRTGQALARDIAEMDAKLLEMNSLDGRVHALEVGLIATWSGALADIPSGWRQCDGGPRHAGPARQVRGGGGRAIRARVPRRCGPAAQYKRRVESDRNSQSGTSRWYVPHVHVHVWDWNNWMHWWPRCHLQCP